MYGESASADVNAAASFLAKLKKNNWRWRLCLKTNNKCGWNRFVVEKNANKNLVKKEKSQLGFKVAKDHLKLLFGRNAAGGY